MPPAVAYSRDIWISGILDILSDFEYPSIFRNSMKFKSFKWRHRKSEFSAPPQLLSLPKIFKIAKKCERSWCKIWLRAELTRNFAAIHFNFTNELDAQCQSKKTFFRTSKSFRDFTILTFSVQSMIINFLELEFASNNRLEQIWTFSETFSLSPFNYAGA